MAKVAIKYDNIVPCGEFSSLYRHAGEFLFVIFVKGQRDLSRYRHGKSP